MRKNLYKIVAVFIAASMMSMTVFAAEDANFAGDDKSIESQPAESVENKEETTPASEEVAPAQEQTNTDTGAETTKEKEEGSQSGDDKKEAEAGTSTETGTETSTEAGTGASTEAGTGTSTETGAGASTETGTGTSTETGTGTSTDATTGGSTETSTTEGEPTERREAVNNEMTSEPASEETASSQEANWSNGAVTDVMGVRSQSNDDGTVTISYKVRHENDWENTGASYPITVTITNADGTTSEKQITIGWDGVAHGENYANIGSISRSSEQTDTETLEITIDSSWFGTDNFTVSSGDYTATNNGATVTDNDNVGEDAVYEGVSIDGNFTDWDAVTKVDMPEPTDYNGGTDKIAWVVEEDYVYILITSEGGNAESATWSGSHGNGKYAITTDLGRTLLLQVTQDGAVAGCDDAIVNHSGSQWEIAIPVSSLPDNDGQISLGYYQQDSVLTGYIPGTEVSSKTDITYDGITGEWKDYPHTLIQYATAGTQESVPDGEAAIYTDNYIYGHCETSMQAHLNERGTEFTSAVTVAANIASQVGGSYSVGSDQSYRYANEDLHMRLVSVDSSGNINWNPDFNNLENGSYEYFIFDTSAWGTSQNINNLVEADVLYGKATVIVSDTKQEMEWYIIPEAFAARYGMDATEIKTVSAQYGKIGREWSSNAGTSTGPIGSVAMVSAFAAFPMLKKSKFILKLLNR